MKYIYKLVMVLMVVAMSSCDITELDLLDSPNAVSPENASVNDLLVSVQGSFDGMLSGMEGFAGGVTRMTALTPFSVYDYANATQPNDYDGIWSNVYAGLFPDIDALISIAEERSLNIHSGVAKVMKAYAMVALVDFFGNVPYSQAGQGVEVISPTADDGASVYAAAEALLDQAISQMSGSTAAKPSTDTYYGGDPDKWVKAANTLKLKMAVTTRLVDGGAAGKINSLIAGGNLIDDASEDLHTNYGQTRNNPNSRHPRYNEHYETTDGGYLGNYFMWLLVGDKRDANDDPVTDPRLRFYFYRQVKDAETLDKNEYSCHFTDLPDQNSKPAHWAAVDPNIPYCVLPNGYFGRDHINGEGIPPDGNLRTVWGLYPAAGQFDDDSYSEAQQAGTTGGMGQGIRPILLSSYTYFWRAEADLTIGTDDDAREMLEKGMRASIAKVISFKSKVPGTMSRAIVNPTTGESRTVEAIYVPTSDDVDEYVNFVLAAYDAADADGKLDIIMKEHYIALWGNGIDSYNNYRRTGKPNNMGPTLEPGAGPFIRSAFYPATHVNLNASASQKELTAQVFWDTGVELR